MTNGERFREVQELFERLVDLDPASRAAALDEVDDVELRGLVQELLRADAEAGPAFLPRATDQPPLVVSEPADLVDATIGGFHLIRRIGSGGMGTVYEAEQDSPRRRVALKLLRPVPDIESMARRFRREAEILARFQHPGIARVFAAGVHPVDGPPLRVELPWYAMELLDGAVPITAYADGAGLDVDGRLDLFLRVTDAVEYAHRHGVIHRDLKPANIPVDDHGMPKVIDFGVARELTADPQHTLLTRHGEVLGTLRYMAPEQLLRDTDAVDVRADVYALGVVLYELLCGAAPYDIASSPFAETVARLTSASPRSPRQLRPDLPRELEWILLRSLEREPDLRYASVRELAGDLRRFARHEPVIAAPPSGIYRVTIFLRRHRLAVAAGALVLLSLLGGLVASTVSLGRMRDANRIAEAEAKRASEEAETSRLMLSFFTQAFAQARLEQRGKELKVVDLLAQAVDFARQEFSGRGASVQFLYALGQLAASIGDDETAEQCLREAVAQLLSDPEADPRASALLLSDLVKCQMFLGQLATAEETLARARAAAATAGDDDLVTKLDGVGASLLYRLGRFDEAEPLARAVYETLRAQRADPAEVVLAENMWSITLQELGRNEEAEPLAREVYELTVATMGERSPRALVSANNLASLWNDIDRPAAARALLEPILPVAVEVCGEDHSTTQLVVSTLAMACYADGATDRGIDLLRQRIARDMAEHAVLSPVVLQRVRNLGSMMHAQGRSEEAETLLRDALARIDPGGGDDHPSAAVVRAALGQVLMDTGRAALAVPLLRSARDSLAARYGAEHRDTRKVAAWLARASAELGPGGTP